MNLPTIDEIKDRKIVQWALAYLTGAWLVLQVVVALGGVYGWPTWLLRTVPIVLAIGFLGTLVVAWYHGERGRQRVGGVELGLLAILFGLGGVGVYIMRPHADGTGLERAQAAALSRLSDAEALDLAYDWGISGDLDASTGVLEQLLDRAESDSARMSLLALGASLLSRDGRADEATAWMVRMMEVDPLALTLAADASSEMTGSYLEATRRYYAAHSRPSTVRSIAVLPQNAYTVGFPDSLAELRDGLAEAVPMLLQVRLFDALKPTEIALLERAASFGVPLSIGEVRVGLPGADWLWVDEASMPESVLRASHHVLSACTFLGAPFEAEGQASVTCTARLLSAEGVGVRASARGQGDTADVFALVDEMASALARQITDGG